MYRGRTVWQGVHSSQHEYWWTDGHKRGGCISVYMCLISGAGWGMCFCMYVGTGCVCCMWVFVFVHMCVGACMCVCAWVEWGVGGGHGLGFCFCSFPHEFCCSVAIDSKTNDRTLKWKKTKKHGKIPEVQHPKWKCGSGVVEVNVCLWLRSASGLVFQMKFQPNDLQQLREMCDEIKIFEGIQHPNLVKYYGVEVHKVRRRKRKGEGGENSELRTLLLKDWDFRQ